jgi:hypothetical protein
MDRAHIGMSMERSILVTGSQVNVVAKVSTNLPMEKNIQIGSITIVMDRESTPGATGESIVEHGK